MSSDQVKGIYACIVCRNISSCLSVTGQNLFRTSWIQLSNRSLTAVVHSSTIKGKLFSCYHSSLNCSVFLVKQINLHHGPSKYACYYKITIWVLLHVCTVLNYCTHIHIFIFLCIVNSPNFKLPPFKFHISAFTLLYHNVTISCLHLPSAGQLPVVTILYYLCLLYLCKKITSYVSDVCDNCL